MPDFYAIPTDIGEAKLANALALGVPLQITHIAVGDGAGLGAQGTPLPDPEQTALVSERRRAPLNTLAPDPVNASVLIAEQVIPEDVGGWWIREMGLFDVDGTLIAVCNTPPTYKPVLASGSGRTQVVRMQIIVADVAAVTLKIDPAVVLATRQYCDSKISEELNKLDGKQSARVATTAAIALIGLQTIDDIVLTAGDRVLVKDQAAAKDNGVYVVAAGAWVRATDADAGAEITAGMSVTVEQGTANAESLWVLVTDGPIVLGTTALTFDTIGRRSLAPLTSPALTGFPTAPTQEQFDSSTKLATSEFVQRALGSFSGQAVLAGSTELTSAHIGQVVNLNAESSAVITLPPSAGLPIGSSISIVANGSEGTIYMLQGNAGEPIVVLGRESGTTAALLPGDTATVVYLGSGSWGVLGGSIQLPYTPGFGASIAAHGFQKLPSGLIFQFGTANHSDADVTVTLPVAFPSLFAGVLACPALQAQVPTRLSCYAFQQTTVLTSFALGAWDESTGNRAVCAIRWFAFGY